MSVYQAQPAHEEFYQDLADILGKYAGKLSAEETLAIASNMLGKIIALQDQRTTTKDRAMKIVCANIEMGNQHIVGELDIKTEGEA